MSNEMQLSDGYSVKVVPDPYIGGFRAKLISPLGGVLAEPHASDRLSAVYQLIKELRWAKVGSGDVRLAKEIDAQLETAIKKAGQTKNGSVPPNSLDAALDHVRSGGRLVVATALRVYIIDKKTLAKWEKSGHQLLKVEGDGYRMKTGKSSVYLLPGQLQYKE